MSWMCAGGHQGEERLPEGATDVRKVDLEENLLCLSGPW